MQKEEMKTAGYNILEESPNSLEAFLQTNYPQVFKDGEFDLNELKNLLNIHTETRGYGLNFVGKSFALQKYSQETKMELKINQKLSKNFGETQNAVIRGDNLDALKVLKNNYAGQVKCIYIDPPYNTKSDEFVYSDNFKQSENELLEGYTESEIQRMEGIFKTKKSHSGWLAFMLPRLKLARDLLREDGVIFVSIDDNEQANLKLLMDEVFGEGEFVMSFIRKTVSNRAMAKYSNTQHEYTLCFAKDISNLELIGKDKDLSVYQNPDNDPNGAWVSGNPSRVGGYVYEIKNPYTGKIDTPPKGRGWVFKEEKIEELVKNNALIFKQEHKPNERGFVIKNYIKDLNSETSLVNSLDTCDNKFMNQVATKEMIELMGDKYFDFPKPVALIKHLLQISTAPGDLVLDFFAGSGTTGQAVMELNHENPEKQPRNFILVQWNEEIKEGKEAHKFCVENGLEPVISSITIERLRRAGAKYSGDVGFKVFDCIKKNGTCRTGQTAFN